MAISFGQFTRWGLLNHFQYLQVQLMAIKKRCKKTNSFADWEGHETPFSPEQCCVF